MATIHFVINPTAGRGPIARMIHQVRARLESAGHASHCQYTRKRPAGSRSDVSIPEGTTAVVAVGGDGTVRDVARSLVGTPTPLAILPTGTENLVARHFGHRPDAARLLDTLVRGTTRRMDVVQTNREIFLVVAGIGFDAEVVRRLSSRRKSHITHLDYLAPLWRTFWEHRFPVLSVEIAGRPVFTSRALILVGNLPAYGGGLRILRHAVLDDGLLDVCIYPCSNRLQLLVHAFNTVFGRHLRRGSAVYLRADRLSITGPASSPVQLDGDTAGSLPMDLQVLPGALNILLPPESG